MLELVDLIAHHLPPPSYLQPPTSTATAAAHGKAPFVDAVDMAVEERYPKLTQDENLMWQDETGRRLGLHCSL